MYHDLKEIYWLEGIKQDISKFMEECQNYQQVKAEHLKSGGLTPPIGDSFTLTCSVLEVRNSLLMSNFW